MRVNKIIAIVFTLLIFYIFIGLILAEPLQDATKTNQDLKKFSDNNGKDKQTVWEADISSNGDKVYRNDIVFSMVKDIFEKQRQDQKSSATLGALGETAISLFFQNLNQKGVSEIGGIKITDVDALKKMPIVDLKRAGIDISGILRPKLESLEGFGSIDLKWSEKGKSIIGNGEVYVNLEKLPFGVTKVKYDEASKSFNLEFNGGGKLTLAKGSTDENGNIKIFSGLDEKSSLRKLISPLKDLKSSFGIEDFTFVAGGKEGLGNLIIDDKGIKLTGDGAKVKYGDFVFGRKIGEVGGESSIVIENDVFKIKNTEVQRVGFAKVGSQSEELIIGSGDPKNYKGKNFLLMDGENLLVGGKGKVEALKDLQTVIAYDADKTSGFTLKSGQVNLLFKGEEFFYTRDATKKPLKINEIDISIDGAVKSGSYTLDPNNPNGNIIDERKEVSAGKKTLLGPGGASVDIQIELTKDQFDKVVEKMDKVGYKSFYIPSYPGGWVEQQRETTIQDQFVDILKEQGFELKSSIHTPANAISFSSNKVSDFVNSNWNFIQDRVLSPFKLPAGPLGEFQLNDDAIKAISSIKTQVLTDTKDSYISTGDLGFSLKYTGNGPQIVVYSGGKQISTSSFTKDSNEGKFLNQIMDLTLRLPDSSKPAVESYPGSTLSYLMGQYTPNFPYGEGYVSRLYRDILGRGSNYWDQYGTKSIQSSFKTLKSNYLKESTTTSPKPPESDWNQYNY